MMTEKAGFYTRLVIFFNTRKKLFETVSYSAKYL